MQTIRKAKYLLPTKTIEMKLASVGDTFEFVDECFPSGMEYKVVWSTKCTNVQQQSTGRHFVQSTTGTVHDLFEHQP